MDVARIQGDLVMNASIPYFFWWGLSEIPKKYDVARSTLSYFLQVVEPNAQRISKLTSAQFCVVAMYEIRCEPNRAQADIELNPLKIIPL